MPRNLEHTPPWRITNVSGDPASCRGWVHPRQSFGVSPTDGLPSATDAPLQRSELAKSANRVGSRSCDRELEVRQLIDTIADSRRMVGPVEVDPLPKSRRPTSRSAVVSAYDHRVGRRDDVMCHFRPSPVRHRRNRSSSGPEQKDSASG
jgi:hypothetical protein